jgi:AraC family transcriptional regulator
MNALTQLPMPPSVSRVNLGSSAGLGWNGFGAVLLGISAGVHRIPAMTHHRVGIHIGTPVRARCVCDERHSSRIQAHGDADVVPAGLDGLWADESDCTILSIWIDEPFVRKIAEQMDAKPARAEIRPRFQMRDPRFQHLAWALRAELSADAASDLLYAESLCTAMVIRLMDGVTVNEATPRTLAPRVAARVIDFIESNLAQRLTLAELAAVAGLSVPHFKALFRATLGMAAHQYVVQRRVERAKNLLLAGKLSASQIALDAGFSHQSHMAHWVNRVLGVTPREIARTGVPDRRSGRLAIDGDF